MSGRRGERGNEGDVLGVPGFLPRPPQPIAVIALADGERLNAWVGGADLLVLCVSTASSLRSAARYCAHYSDRRAVYMPTGLVPMVRAFALFDVTLLHSLRPYQCRIGGNCPTGCSTQCNLGWQRDIVLP